MPHTHMDTHARLHIYIFFFFKDCSENNLDSEAAGTHTYTHSDKATLRGGWGGGVNRKLQKSPAQKHKKSTPELTTYYIVLSLRSANSEWLSLYSTLQNSTMLTITSRLRKSTPAELRSIESERERKREREREREGLRGGRGEETKLGQNTEPSLRAKWSAGTRSSFLGGAHTVN